MSPVVALPHLRALCPTLLQRPHLCIGASTAARIYSNSDEFLCVDDADECFVRVDLDGFPRTCTYTGSRIALAAAAALILMSMKKTQLCTIPLPLVTHWTLYCPYPCTMINPTTNAEGDRPSLVIYN